MKEMRPTSAYSGLHSRNGPIKRQPPGTEEPRPNSGLTVRTRVLKSNSTAYNNWLRRSDDFNYNLKKHPRDYNGVQTFNLRTGCKVTKSPSQLQVHLDPDEFFNPKAPKMSSSTMPVKEMELLIKSLQEQVRYLTVYLEEEKLHHAGTKKRAKVDVENAKAEMELLHEKNMEEVMLKQEEFINELKQEQSDQMAELEDELRRQYKKLENEYKMLQASFKNYKSKIAEDMEEKWNSRKRDFDWEKQRSVENAVEVTRKTMEEKFNQERISIRTEYKELMQQMVADQRREMEEFMRKMSDGKSSIEELKARADQADRLEIMLNETKEQLQSAKKELRKVNHSLKDTQSKLTVYQNQFEEKVSSVEDKYRQKIDDLIHEISDFRFLLIKKAETQYLERAAADELQKRWTKFVQDKFENGVLAKNHATFNDDRAAGDGSHATKDSNTPSDTVTKQIRIDVDLRGGGESGTNEKKECIPANSVDRRNGVQVPLSVIRPNENTNLSTLELQARKHSAKKKNDPPEIEKDISVTKAGADKIRPRLPMSTISLLETANLPFTDQTEIYSEPNNEVRPHSPDVIY